MLKSNYQVSKDCVLIFWLILNGKTEPLHFLFVLGSIWRAYSHFPLFYSIDFPIFCMEVIFALKWNFCWKFSTKFHSIYQTIFLSFRLIEMSQPNDNFITTQISKRLECSRTLHIIRQSIGREWILNNTDGE